MTTQKPWSKPFAGFRVFDMLFASVWLIFLLIPLGLALASLGIDRAAMSATIALTALFITIYLFYFGTYTYFPRGWSQCRRSVTVLAVLVVIALTSSAFVGPWALSFFPFTCALIIFTCPPRLSVPTVAVSSLIVTGLTFLFLAEMAVGLLGATLSPLFILGIGLLSHKDDENRDLRHRLELTEERERIALDVHDLLGHSLTVINLKSELAKRLLDTQPSQARAQLDEIASLSRTALAEVRSTVTHLRSPTLPGAFDATARALQTAGISYSLPDDTGIAGPNGALFASVMKEATTNILRHAQAGSVEVRLAADRLQITDDGVGLSSDAEEKGHGLRGIKKRVQQAGGTAFIEQAPGGGTRIFVTMSDNQDRWE
ncbi:Sensor histidine kinase DesK [Corynebacterium urogenitale]|uniref:Sensor histidine kinase DesK n=1 Tax=Corynebacterium urogenitale TaxID=2487892 RepID=A0A5J6ZAW8_9CORY|nr:sensor histidine kinase [Corynebacterium urogenitale]QFQ02677.1 Sensor histidine kinase DesK [Corynebacterium urogenitale]